MKSTDPAAIRERMQRVHARYDAHFAGQPRVSRDPSLLDAMSIELDGLLTQARALGPSGRSLVADLEKNRGLYTREAAAIREAQAASPEALTAHEISSWAQLTFSRYRRHFANRARATRDLGLLAELVADLERHERTMGELARRAPGEGIDGMQEQIAQSLALYRKERGEIAAARGAGTLQEQGDVLAAVANAQFALYRNHFAGKARLSRRPALLERMIESLAGVHDRMKALEAQGLHAESNTRNIGIVEQRLSLYREELEQVRRIRQQSSLTQLVTAFGEAANKTFDTYREGFAGKDRAGRDPDLLTALCDELFDLARQMDDLDRVREDETNQHNLAVVLDHLRLYEREYGLILEAKSGS